MEAASEVRVADNDLAVPVQIVVMQKADCFKRARLAKNEAAP
jgi:hypothetical protein